MGKILVLYDTRSGHTGQMAEYVREGAESLPSMETRLLSVDDASIEDVLWCDGIAVGTPTYTGILSWKMKRFWDEIVQKLFYKVDGKIGCAFSSSGGWGGGAELTLLSIHIVLMNIGFLVFGVPDYVAKQFTLHYGAITAGAPDEERDRAACYRLGHRLAHWVAVYRDGQDLSLGANSKERA